MSKKANKLNYFYCIALVLCVAALAMVFVPAVKIVGKLTDSVYYTGNGLNTIFGYSDGSVSVFSFSVLNLMTYALPLAALVLVALKMASGTKGKLLDCIAIVLLVVASVFFFLAPTFAISEFANVGLHVKKLAIGAILGGVASILATLVLIANLVIKRK